VTALVESYWLEQAGVASLTLGSIDFALVGLSLKPASPADRSEAAGQLLKL
jgi:hypothetical protein